MVHQIAIVVFPAFQVLDLAALAAFELANNEAGIGHYDVSLVSESGGAIKSSFGISMDSVTFGRATMDTVLVTGSPGMAPATPALRRYLAWQFESARRIASIGRLQYRVDLLHVVDVEGGHAVVVLGGMVEQLAQ